MSDSPCPCCSNKSYATCCQPFLEGNQQATTAEALMRSRYTAYTKVAIDYIQATTHPMKRAQQNWAAAKSWAEQATWLGLKVVATKAGQTKDETGTVSFVAEYQQAGQLQRHEELSTFKKMNGSWYYWDGRAPVKKPVVKRKIGRNAPCPCQSGKKYKQCCGKA